MSRLRTFAPLVLILLALGGVLHAARGAALYRVIEWKTLDWRFRLLARPERAHPDIVLAMLDQRSLDHFEGDDVYWPWPRSIYDAVLGMARQGGAKAVVLDVLFTSPSPYGESEDEAFAEGLKRTPGAVLAMELSRHEDPRRAEPPPERFALPLPPETPALEKRSGRLPVPALAAAAARLADVSTPPDADGVFRRVPLLSKLGGRLYPTLPLAAVLAAGAGPLAYEDGRLSLGGRPIPLDEGGMLIDFHGSALGSGPRTYASYPLGNLILSWQRLQEGEEPLIRPEALKDKLVFVGLSAPGLLDNRPSPVSPVFPGTEIMAAAADNLLRGAPLRRAGAGAAALMLLLALALGAAAALWARRLGALLGSAAAGSALLLAVAAAAFRRGVWLDLAGPQLALFGAFAATSAFSYLAEGRKKAFIKKAFGHYLAPEVVEQISRDPDSLKLGGEKREITIFFSDMQGFTTLSETLDPEKLVEIINRYLGAMTDIIMETGGVVDKYEGDLIMAFWGAPARQDDHALRAVDAAFRNLDRLTGLQKEFEAEGITGIAIRIGINSGLCAVGNMGSEKRFNYTVMGDHVNLASRLEGANKAYGTALMASEMTMAHLDGKVDARELDLLRVKGKNKPIRVYELLGMTGRTEPGKLAVRDRFEAALALYRSRRFEEARRAFEALEGDPPSETYVERCRHYESNPPPSDWDGAYTMTTK